jgi:hypothetical protein
MVDIGIKDGRVTFATSQTFSNTVTATAVVSKVDGKTYPLHSGMPGLIPPEGIHFIPQALSQTPTDLRLSVKMYGHAYQADGVIISISVTAFLFADSANGASPATTETIPASQLSLPASPRVSADIYILPKQQPPPQLADKPNDGVGQLPRDLFFGLLRPWRRHDLAASTTRD